MHTFYLNAILNNTYDELLEIVNKLNTLQESFQFFLREDCSVHSDRDEFKLMEAYRKVTYPQKKKHNLKHLVTILDKPIFISEVDCYTVSHMSRSKGIGCISWNTNRNDYYLMKDILRVAIKLHLSLTFDFGDHNCFFDETPNYNNTNFCKSCGEKIHEKVGYSKMKELEVCVQSVLNNETYHTKTKNILQNFNTSEEINPVQIKTTSTVNNVNYTNEVDNEEFLSDISSVIIMDIIGYSLLTDTQQKKMIVKLQKIIKRNNDLKEHIEEFVFLPTGDGCILAMFGNLCRQAVKMITSLQKDIKKNKLRVRFGINFGSVFRYNDINSNVNIAGGGVNMAARAMDMGDENHILANRTIYDYLGNTDEWHKNIFHFLGKVRIKHDESLDIFNIYDDEFDIGNSEIPKKVKEKEIR